MGGRTPGPLGSDTSIQSRVTGDGDAISILRHLGSQTIAVPSVDMLVTGSPETTTGVASATPTKVKEVTITFKGAYRFKYILTMTSGGAADFVQGQIYRNGAAVGKLTTSVLYTTPIPSLFVEEDIAGWNAGDLAQLYVNNSGGAGSTPAVVSTFGVWGEYALKPPDIPVGVVNTNGV